MTTDSRTRVMIVDDHSIMRDGLVRMLELDGGFEVVGQAADGVEAVRTAPDLEPDVIIMDVMMPVKDGIDACREIMDVLPETRVLMLTAANRDDAVIQSVAAGAAGYLQKYHGEARLLSTIREVAEGEFRIPGEVAKRVFGEIRSAVPHITQGDMGGLTEREIDIVKLFSRGMTYGQIAEARGNRSTTIRNSIYGIQAKLGIKTKQEIVIWAVRNGLLDDYTVEPPPQDPG